MKKTKKNEKSTKYSLNLNSKIQTVISSGKGITLIALIITILLLVIIAGISIDLIVDQGIFNKSEQVVSNVNEKLQKDEETKENILSGWAEIPGKMLSGLTGTRCRHEFSEWVTTKEATCTEPGEKVSICTKCQERRVVQLKKGVHTYSQWTTIKAATCVSEGTEQSTCSKCGNPQTRTIAKLPHNYVNKTCTACGKVVKTDGTWDDSIKVNTPKLLTGMTAVYWDGDTEVTEGNASFNWDNWYDYKDQPAGKDGTSKWANAKTSDGSYWVWIPRYAYQIESGCYTGTVGKINIKFLKNNTNVDNDGNTISKTYPAVSNGKMAAYVTHPVFTNGAANNFRLGEWSAGINGFWVAKYETSVSGTKYKSVPNAVSVASMTIGDMYTAGINYDSSKNSHMMKNSEWGAVSYLTHSSYGRNGVKVALDANSPASTTMGGDDTTSTGNKSGVYQLSGKSWERVAGAIINGNSNLSTASSFITSSMISMGNAGQDTTTTSTKYATIYPYNSSSDTYVDNFKKYKDAGYGFGDAVLETSSNSDGWYSWNSEHAYYPMTTDVFFLRGGAYSNGPQAGIFYYNNTNGKNANAEHSFRLVLI